MYRHCFLLALLQGRAGASEPNAQDAMAVASKFIFPDDDDCDSVM
jgi:hypothetical protein